MKQTKTIIIATIMTIAIILSCTCMLPATAEGTDHGEFYSKLTIVVSTEQISANIWVITCKDRTGGL